jgi:hypothetical protein
MGRVAKGDWRAPRLFYCFVDFSETPPACWIVPSAVVAKALIASAKEWFETPGKNGRRRNPTNMRYFADHYDGRLKKKYPLGRWLDKYRDNWRLLEKSA